MSILTLLLIAAAVYFLWFHKFTLPDGTEVKGWLAKNKAKNNESASQPDVQQPVEEESDEVEFVEEEPERDEGNWDEMEAPELNIESEPMAFSILRYKATQDLFDTGWDYMTNYYGWLLLGVTRHDLINNDTVWPMIANGYVEHREAFREYYTQRVKEGVFEPSFAETMPVLMANQGLLNGFSVFTAHAREYYDDKTWHRLEGRIKSWTENLKKEQEAAGDELVGQPVAAVHLVRLYTFLQDQYADSFEDNTEMFKSLYDFDFVLPDHQ